MLVETPFARILDAAEQLVIEEQEDLIRILQSRLRDHRRFELIREVQEARQEFALGQCKLITHEKLMEELLS